MTLSSHRLRILKRVCWTLALAALAIPFVFPFLWMISAGFKDANEIFGEPSLIPKVWRWRTAQADRSTASIWTATACVGRTPRR